MAYTALVLIAFMAGLLSGETGWKMADWVRKRKLDRLKALDRIDYEEWRSRCPQYLYSEVCDWYVEGPYKTMNRDEAMRKKGDPRPARRVRL